MCVLSIKVTMRKKSLETYLMSHIYIYICPADLRLKLKEIEKKDKYLDLTRELKNYGTWKWHWYEI